MKKVFLRDYFRKGKANNSGVSMLTLVITVVVIIILALVAFSSSTRTVDEANYSTYVNNVSEVETFFEDTSVSMHGTEELRENTKRDEQIYNYVAKGGKTEEDFLSVSELPSYTVIKDDADIGITLPSTKVESGTGKMVPIKYASTKQGQIFTWPPYDYNNQYYITKTDTVEHKMQTQITVGQETFEIVIDPLDGSLKDVVDDTQTGENNNPAGGNGNNGNNESAHTHTFSAKTTSDEYKKSDATCDSPATYYYKCTGCEEKGTTTYTVGGAEGHAYGTWTITTPSNCKDTGTKARKCTKCNDTQTDSVAKNPDNHSGGETSEITTPATCAQEGVKSYKCAGCKEVFRTETIAKDTSKHTGKETSSITTPATCAKEGVKTIKCADCNATLRTESVAQDASKHGTNEKAEITKPATCAEAGTKTIKCGDCSATLRTETIEKLTTHGTEVSEVTKKATCVATGTKSYKCSVCSTVLRTETITKDSSNHDGSEVLSGSEPATCTTDGYKTYACSGCNAIRRKETIAATGHVDSDENQICDTCKEDWNVYTLTEIWMFKEYFSKASAITQDINFTSKNIEYTSIEAKTDSKWYTIKYGNEEIAKGEPGPYGDDSDVSWEFEEDRILNFGATPQEVSSEFYTWFTSNATQVTDHIWSDYTETTAATCTTAGVKTRTCKGCGETETAEIAALGHTWSEWTTIDAGTCTVPETQERKCSTCGSTESRSIPAKGHDYKERITAATCTEEGYTTYICDDCGDVYKDNYTDALEHIDADSNDICDRCDEDWNEYSLSNIWIFNDTISGLDAYYQTPYFQEVLFESEERQFGYIRLYADEGYENIYYFDEECDNPETTYWKISENNEPNWQKSKIINFGADSQEVSKEFYAWFTANASQVTEHIWSDYTETTAATCTTVGLKTRTCLACGETETEEIAALGHTWGEWLEVTAETCTTNGEQGRKCSACGSAETNTVPAKGHYYKVRVIIETCTEEGYTTYVCDDCGYSYTDDYTAALGHIDSDSDNLCDRCGATIKEVEDLGNIEISDPDAEITYDPDTGEMDGVIPPAEDEPEQTPDEIPEEELPELISVKYGNFKQNTTYTPGTYEDVAYEQSYTRNKYPVSYMNTYWSQWKITKDEEGNVISTEPGDIQLENIEDTYSTWIVYDFETEKYLESNGVKGDTVEIWTIYDSADDSLENAVYLAAYLNKLDGKTSRHIAKHDGTNYVAYDADAQISAIKTFTETYVVTGTKTVEITKPSTTTEYVYIPVGELRAEKEMTWEKWLASEYNTIGETAPIIKTSDFVDVAYTDVIDENLEYGFVVYELSGIWTWNDNADFDTLMYDICCEEGNIYIDFTSNEESFVGIYSDGAMSAELLYLKEDDSYTTAYGILGATSTGTGITTGMVCSWNTDYQTLDFGTTPQSVSKEFYNWFTANATQQVYELDGVWSFNETLTQTGWASGEAKYELINFIWYPAGEDSALERNVVEYGVFAEGHEYFSMHNQGTYGGHLYSQYHFRADTGCTIMDLSNGDPYATGWLSGLVDPTVDFGTTPQTVSKEFYDWFCANATKVEAETYPAFMHCPDSSTMYTAFIFEEGMTWNELIKSDYNVEHGTTTKLFELDDEGYVIYLEADEYPDMYDELILGTDTISYPGTFVYEGSDGKIAYDSEVSSLCESVGHYEEYYEYNNKEYCVRCGEDIAKCTHNYESVVTAATCTSDGYTTYTCSKCSDTYTGDEVDALGHNYESAATTATCLEAGYTTYTCSRCSDTYTGDEVEALGHNYTSKVTAATCTTAGYTTYTCSRCSDTYTGNAIAALGHDYKSVVTAATCLEGGYTTYTCSRCSSSYTGNAIEALGHADTNSDEKCDRCSIEMKVYKLSGKWAFNEGPVSDGTITLPDETIQQYISYSYGYDYTGYTSNGFYVTSNGISLNGDEEEHFPQYTPALSWEMGMYTYIDFGSEAQEVSKEFYEWFTVNAIEQEYKLEGVWLLNNTLTQTGWASNEAKYELINFTLDAYGEDGTILERNVMEYGVFGEGHEYFSMHNQGTYGGHVYSQYHFSIGTGCAVMSYSNGDANATGWIDSVVNPTVDFGSTPQSVSKEFYEWFTANAVSQ